MSEPSSGNAGSENTFEGKWSAKPILKAGANAESTTDLANKKSVKFDANAHIAGDLAKLGPNDDEQIKLIRLNHAQRFPVAADGGRSVPKTPVLAKRPSLSRRVSATGSVGKTPVSQRVKVGGRPTISPRVSGYGRSHFVPSESEKPKENPNAEYIQQSLPKEVEPAEEVFWKKVKEGLAEKYEKARVNPVVKGIAQKFSENDKVKRLEVLAGRGATTAENLKRKARRLPISICIPDYKKKNDLKKRFKLSIKHAYKKPNGIHKTASCSNSKCDSAGRPIVGDVFKCKVCRDDKKKRMFFCLDCVEDHPRDHSLIVNPPSLALVGLVCRWGMFWTWPSVNWILLFFKGGALKRFLTEKYLGNILCWPHWFIQWLFIVVAPWALAKSLILFSMLPWWMRYSAGTLLVLITYTFRKAISRFVGSGAQLSRTGLRKTIVFIQSLTTSVPITMIKTFWNTLHKTLRKYGLGFLSKGLHCAKYYLGAPAAWSLQLFGKGIEGYEDFQFKDFKESVSEFYMNGKAAAVSTFKDASESVDTVLPNTKEFIGFQVRGWMVVVMSSVLMFLIFAIGASWEDNEEEDEEEENVMNTQQDENASRGLAKFKLQYHPSPRKPKPKRKRKRGIFRFITSILNSFFITLLICICLVVTIFSGLLAYHMYIRIPKYPNMTVFDRLNPLYQPTFKQELYSVLTHLKTWYIQQYRFYYSEEGLQHVVKFLRRLYSDKKFQDRVLKEWKEWYEKHVTPETIDEAGKVAGRCARMHINGGWFTVKTTVRGGIWGLKWARKRIMLAVKGKRKTGIWG